MPLCTQAERRLASQHRLPGAGHPLHDHSPVAAETLKEGDLLLGEADHRRSAIPADPAPRHTVESDLPGLGLHRQLAVSGGHWEGIMWAMFSRPRFSCPGRRRSPGPHRIDGRTFSPPAIELRPQLSSLGGLIGRCCGFLAHRPRVVTGFPTAAIAKNHAHVGWKRAIVASAPRADLDSATNVAWKFVKVALRLGPRRIFAHQDPDPDILPHRRFGTG
jgi:hypothetical protein